VAGVLLDGTTHLATPDACTEQERRELARLVRQGFDAVVETLDGRIRAARCLAFRYAADGTLAAIAALKAPDEAHRAAIFAKAEAPVSHMAYELDLGWVFVLPAHRGKRIAPDLCRRLLARVPAAGVFATTRTNNDPMIGILRTLGFTRVGKPYPRRDEQLVLFLRAPVLAAAAASST
jgi:ribosomal protein S18 acetylase RimI-like enzyme